MKRNIFAYYLNFFLYLLFILYGCQTDSKKEMNEIKSIPPSLNDSIKSENTVIILSDKEINELKIKTEEVKFSKNIFVVNAPGVVKPAANHYAIISTPVDGRISKILKHEGEFVYRGEVLAEIESLTFGSLVAEYLQAKTEEDFQNKQMERYKQLADKMINSESEMEKAKADYQRAIAASRAAYSKLKAIGISEKEIKNYVTSDEFDPVLRIKSPISGIIDKHMVELGQSVNANEMMASVINPEQVLIQAYVSPEDGIYIKSGDKVKIHRRNETDSVISGKVLTINPGLDETNRSVVVNLIIPTKSGWPKPGQNVRVEIETSNKKDVFSVNTSAITYINNDPVVYVKIEENKYEQRSIKISEIRNEMAIVSSGLKAKENVAITQVFSIKAMARYERLLEE